METWTGWLGLTKTCLRLPCPAPQGCVLLLAILTRRTEKFAVQDTLAHQTGLEPSDRILYGGILSRGGVLQTNTISLAGLWRTPLRSDVVVCHSHQPASDAIPPIQPAYACRAPQLLGIFFPRLGEDYREKPRRDTTVSYLKSEIIAQVLHPELRHHVSP